MNAQALITLSLKDQERMTPEVEAWLRKAEKALNAELQPVMERQLHSLMVYGTTHPAHLVSFRTARRMGTCEAWDFYPEGLSHESAPLTPLEPSRAPAHLPASYQGEPHE